MHFIEVRAGRAAHRREWSCGSIFSVHHPLVVYRHAREIWRAAVLCGAQERQVGQVGRRRWDRARLRGPTWGSSRKPPSPKVAQCKPSPHRRSALGRTLLAGRSQARPPLSPSDGGAFYSRPPLFGAGARARHEPAEAAVEAPSPGGLDGAAAGARGRRRQLPRLHSGQHREAALGGSVHCLIL